MLWILGSRSLLQATDYSWSTANSGNFNTAANWFPLTGPPGTNTGDSVTIDIVGTYEITLDSNLPNALNSFTIDNSDASFLASGRTFTVNGLSQIFAANITWADSTWAGAGFLTLGGGALFRTQGASVINTNVFTNNGNVIIEGGVAPSGLTVLNGFTNTGTIDLTSTATGNTYLSITNGTLTNSGTLRLSLGDGLPSNTRTVTSNINNQGSIIVDTPGGVFDKNDATYTNTGTVSIGAAAKLAISGTGSISFTNQTQGIIEGSGELDVSNPNILFTNHGTTQPGTLFDAGILSFTGDFHQLASGNLNINLNGTVVGESYDRLVVTGSATLDGTLNVTLADGYTPAITDTFTIVTSTGTRSGTFSTVNFVDYYFDITYTPNSVVLSNIAPVPEPAILGWFLGFAGIGMATRRETSCLRIRLQQA